MKKAKGYLQEGARPSYTVMLPISRVPGSGALTVVFRSGQQVSNFDYYEVSLHFTTEQFWSASRRYLHNFWLFFFNLVPPQGIFQHLWNLLGATSGTSHMACHLSESHATSGNLMPPQRISGNLPKMSFWYFLYRYCDEDDVTRTTTLK